MEVRKSFAARKSIGVFVAQRHGVTDAPTFRRDDGVQSVLALQATPDEGTTTPRSEAAETSSKRAAAMSPYVSPYILFSFSCRACDARACDASSRLVAALCDKRRPRPSSHGGGMLSAATTTPLRMPLFPKRRPRTSGPISTRRASSNIAPNREVPTARRYVFASFHHCTIAVTIWHGAGSKPLRAYRRCSRR